MFILVYIRYFIHNPSIPENAFPVAVLHINGKCVSAVCEYYQIVLQKVSIEFRRKFKYITLKFDLVVKLFLTPNRAINFRIYI